MGTLLVLAVVAPARTKTELCSQALHSVVLSRNEVNELLTCTENLKQRTFLTTLYATGMRFSEAANLRLVDIDSQRMQIHIRHGKGAKRWQQRLANQRGT